MIDTQNFPKREAVATEATWDLSAIYPNEAAYEEALKTYQEVADQFKQDYEGRLETAADIAQAIHRLDEIKRLDSRLAHYAFLAVEADRTDAQAAERFHHFAAVYQKVSETLLFFNNHLLQESPNQLEAVIEADPQTELYIQEIRYQQKDYLGAKIEDTLFQFQRSFSQPYEIYNNAKLADLTFPDFEVDGKTYPLSFVLYEDLYMYAEDTALRRAAFDAFSKELAKYQHTFATAYYAHVSAEKAQATIRGYDSVIDYLLNQQKVDRELYDRQIDLIMEHLAPVMQKYIRHLQEVRGLDKVTYADLKIDLDPDFNQEISFQDSKKVVQKAMAVMGDDYFDLIAPAYSERWVDWAQNIGKSTGGFATSCADVHPYILMSWTNQLSDVYTLIHELGHAGQFIQAEAHNLFVSSEPSMYVVEAPSTFNELLLTGYLLDQSEDDRMQRYARAKMIANTYFHNFVTHLLEAAYQREVYRLIDQDQAFTAQSLSELKTKVLKEFWGDSVEINPGAELTWMRQPHYYMGLYSYTYSAGLTLATQAFLNIRSGDPEAVTKWKNFLKLGSLPPVEASLIAGVDVSKADALENTIHFLDQTVDEIIAYSEKLKD